MANAPLPRRWLLLVLVLLALALGLTLFRLSRLSRSAGFDINADWAMVDFRSAVYYPAVAFLNGDNPYDRQAFLARYPMEDAFPLYLPAVLMIHAPFGLIGYLPAAIAFYIWTVVLTLFTAFLALRLNGFRAGAAPVVLVASIMILSRPGHMNLLVGQDTLVYVLGTYLALSAADSSPAWSGLGLSLACLKPTFGIPIALLMLAGRRFRPLLYGAGIGALLNLPPLLILIRDSGGPTSFLRAMVENFGAWRNEPVVDASKSLLSISASAVLGRLMDRTPGLIGEAVVMVIVLGTAAAALRLLDRRKNPRDWPLAASVVCLAALTGIHHQPYDLLLLSLPGVALLGRRFPDVFYDRWTGRALAALLAVLAFNYVATHSGVAALRLTGLAYRLVTSINGVALMAFFVIVVSTIFRLRRTIPEDPIPGAGT